VLQARHGDKGEGIITRSGSDMVEASQHTALSAIHHLLLPAGARAGQNPLHLMAMSGLPDENGMQSSEAMVCQAPAETRVGAEVRRDSILVAWFMHTRTLFLSLFCFVGLFCEGGDCSRTAGRGWERLDDERQSLHALIPEFVLSHWRWVLRAQANEARLFDLLLRFGADINQVDSAGDTPLQISMDTATHKRSLSLLSRGASVVMIKEKEVRRRVAGRAKRGEGEGVVGRRRRGESAG